MNDRRKFNKYIVFWLTQSLSELGSSMTSISGRYPEQTRPIPYPVCNFREQEQLLLLNPPEYSSDEQKSWFSTVLFPEKAFRTV